jgi:hypothetical protein
MSEAVIPEGAPQVVSIVKFASRFPEHHVEHQLSCPFRPQSMLAKRILSFSHGVLRPKGSTSNEVSMILLYSTGVQSLDKQDGPFSVHSIVQTGNVSGICAPI